MLTLQGISKSFSGVHVLTDVQLHVQAGEIHALVGENGAGKSTLTRMIAGAHQPDGGTIHFDGRRVVWSSPAQAKAAGIHVIYQEFVLFPDLTVAENIYLGHERRGALGFVDHGRTVREARALLEKFGLDMDPAALVKTLSVAEQQMVEIAKALVHDVKLVILDEPTAVISGREVDVLFTHLRSLRDAGVAVIYISHRLEEIFALCDRVTVLKDGHLIATQSVNAVDRDGLVAMMVGRTLSQLFPPRRPYVADRPVVLEAHDITVPGRVRGASIRLRAGEITGLAGMVGAGRSEFAGAMFGAIPITSGSVLVEGRPLTHLSPARAIAQGIGFVTEDRKGTGLAMQLDIAANITAPTLGEVAHVGLIDRHQENQIAAAEIDRYRIACRGPSTQVAVMSGGNQQKIIVARWARISRRVLMLDEPTRGVDVGTKAEIYRVIQDLAVRGIAILMISSELSEIVAMSDRVVVMCAGSVTGELVADAIQEEAVIRLATTRKAA